MPRVRVHQHVNPLAPFYRQASPPLNLVAIFANCELPLHLDIGCARGRFLLRMAKIEPRWNFLGVEIREPLVAEANSIADEENLNNLHYEFCNAMLWLDRLLQDIPKNCLQMVTIQFPDPWFKKKHAKRRMINADLVGTVVDKLALGGSIFVQTDIEPLSAEIFAYFSADARLKPSVLLANPFLAKTEREIAVETKGQKVYRMLFKKRSTHDRVRNPLGQRDMGQNSPGEDPKY